METKMNRTAKWAMHKDHEAYLWLLMQEQIKETEKQIKNKYAHHNIDRTMVKNLTSEIDLVLGYDFYNKTYMKLKVVDEKTKLYQDKHIRTVNFMYFLNEKGLGHRGRGGWIVPLHELYTENYSLIGREELLMSNNIRRALYREVNISFRTSYRKHTVGSRIIMEIKRRIYGYA